MCLILIAFQKHPQYKLIVAANRDEFYNRATSPAAWWHDVPSLLAGKDLKHGGTWMGVTTGGKFAAITNFRDLKNENENTPSRGTIVSEYLRSESPAEEYLFQLNKKDTVFNGFSLILGEPDYLWVYSNRNHRTLPLVPGIYGISNHFLDTPWPKVVRGKKLFTELLASQSDDLVESIFSMLQDAKPAHHTKLPDTGIGMEWEKLLSPIFIKTQIYGTRSSTVLVVNPDNEIKLIERSFVPKMECQYQFMIKSA
jgi:uncharacterized protein with NRDE domain